MSSGTLTDNFGGTITNNKTRAVSVYSGGTFCVSGNPSITGATNAQGATTTVYVRTAAKIDVTGALDSSCKIGVTMQTPGDFLTLRSQNTSLATTDNFTSDSPKYQVLQRTDEDGSVTFYLGIAAKTITLDNDDAKGAVEVPASASKEEEVTVAVTPKSGWAVDTVTVKDSADKEIPVTGTYGFTMPDDDATVTVTYKKNLTITTPPGGSRSSDLQRPGTIPGNRRRCRIWRRKCTSVLLRHDQESNTR